MAIKKQILTTKTTKSKEYFSDKNRNLRTREYAFIRKVEKWNVSRQNIPW